MKSSKVFVTGGTGFVGKAVVHALQAHNYRVRCLVRPGSEGRLKGFEAIERVSGDVMQPDTLSQAMEGCQIVIHLVGIIWEQRVQQITFERLHAQATHNVVSAAKAAGIHRYIQMSALNVRPNARARYHESKWHAEEDVQSSGLQWTIFRPSIIYGPGDEFISKLAKIVRRFPVVPVLGNGEYRLQPIPVEQVAEAFVRAIDRQESVNQRYEVGGPRPHTMNEVLDLIADCFGKFPARKIHVPLPIIRPLVRLLEPLGIAPVTTDQLIMMEEENVCDSTRFFQDFELKPVELSEGLHRMMHLGNA